MSEHRWAFGSTPAAWRLAPGTRRNKFPRHIVGYPPAPEEWLTSAPLPSPTLGRLLPYQREGVLRAANAEAHLFAWACGAGKTLGALAIAANHARTLVITRAHTKWQWAGQAHQWVPGLQATVLSSRDPVPPTGDLAVINWEVLPHWVDVIQAWNPTLVVFDEIHKAKAWKRKSGVINPHTLEKEYHWLENQSAAAARITRGAQQRLGLTATPVPKDLMDLWSPLDLLEPDCWGTSWDFAMRYCAAKPGYEGRGLDTSGKSNVAELQHRLAGVSHFVTKKMVAQYMPPRRVEVVFVPEECQVRPASFKADIKAAAKYGKHSLFNVMVMEAASRKRSWVEDLVEEQAPQGKNVVVLTGRHREVETIGDNLRKRLTCPVYSSHGGVDTPEQRVKLLEKYNETGGVFIGTLDAFGEAGDYFKETDVGIFAMLPYTPKDLIQGVGRFGRLGGRAATVYLPVAEATVDERINERLLQRLAAAGEVTDDEELLGLSRAFEGSESDEDILKNLLDTWEIPT